MAIWFALAIRRMAWKCPRCGKPFHRSPLVHNPVARRCLNCRLPKWATEDVGPKDAGRPIEGRWFLDPVRLTMNIGFLVAFCSAVGFAVTLLAVDKVAKFAPGLPPEHVAAFNQIPLVIRSHSPWHAASALLLALAARGVQNGVRGANICVRVALVLFYLANWWAWLDTAHGWRAMCLAFDELLRGAAVYTTIVAPVLTVAPLAAAAAGLALFGWLFYSIGRPKAGSINNASRPIA